MSAQAVYLGALRRAYFSDHSVLFYGVLSVCCAAAAVTQLPWSQSLLCFFIGWCLYLPEEYFSHVVVFHGRIPRNAFLYRLLYRLHLGHHDKPRRLDLLFTPVWYTLPALLLNVVLFYWVSGDVWQAAALSAGLMAGYLMFEWWHLIVHSPYEPGPVLRYIRQQHMGHHHWNEKRWFTITPAALVFDVVCQTGGKVHDAPRSKNPPTAGLDEDDARLVRARDHYRFSSDWNENESAIWQLVGQQSSQ
ncbi:hypothetical protein [Jeongeupia naejangsanensis]|uniref:Fatty acid hydroxylase domain-containing protein n=1 Tax=Jeongeupia naejangsanensis TaxID=613195 RepID=A0ABS2BN42_9NEIS|nr:hypothetical protein [Jeongeupia naejangsanensis]MBM3117042.1 hypothetical protein [Jeongeupia naejangsanensis]